MKPAGTAARSDGFQIPRYAFFWLLAAVAVVIIPHVLRLPLWLTALCAVCVGARVLIHQGRLSQPGNMVKRIAVAGLGLLILLQYRRDVFSTDAMVALLLIGITLKLVEMQFKRDVLIVIYLCYFTLIAEFIYSQSIPVAAYVVVAVVIITSALLSLHQNQEFQRPWRTMRLAGIVLLQSVPLMAAFFLLFPRISPLWTMPLQARAGVTGLSESMSPGDIGQLARSAEVAFRVSFKSKAPAYSELYWRAITLDEFNGRRWRRSFMQDRQFLSVNPREMKSWYNSIEYLGRSVEYNVIAEPNYQNWLYTLQMPQIRDDRLIMMSDYQVGAFRPNTQRVSYDVRSFLDFRVSEAQERQSLWRLRGAPPGNARAHDFAGRLMEESGNEPEAYIEAVLKHFRTQEFTYTMSPPVLQDNPVDGFLFDTKAGFCEHFAGSFTFLMRAAGIPARVVTGYMGGEFNPYDGTLTVRQYDAHAWSEVWLDGKGWVRIDPTAAVAPERIRAGSNSALQKEAEFMDDAGFSLMRYRDSQWLNELRLQLEMIDYAWNRFVLNYNQDMQFQFFNTVFGILTKTKIILALLGFMAVSGGIILFTMFRQSTRNQLPAATRHYLRFCDYLGRLGLPRLKGETPGAYLQRVSALHPQWHADLKKITDEFVSLTYAATEADPTRLKAFANKVRQAQLLS